MKHFIPIELPSLPRRSDLLTQADQKCDVFARLLSQLAPERLKTINPNPHGMGAYYALVDYLSTLFPVFESDFEMWAENGMDMHDEAEWLGIPTDLFGIDYDDMSGMEDRIHAVALMVAFQQIDTNGQAEFDDFASLRKYLNVLKPYANYQETRRWWIAPRGRTWVGPWEALDDLRKFACGDTGFFFLDHSHLEVSDAGGQYPYWTIWEIRALARDWQRAKPVWERIRALVDYVAHEPAIRLVTLAGIVIGDEQARMFASRIREREGKPLVEVLA